MSGLTNGVSRLSEQVSPAVQQMTTLAECFKDWKDWLRDRPAIQARWDGRKERMRLERSTAPAIGAPRHLGRL